MCGTAATSDQSYDSRRCDEAHRADVITRTAMTASVGHALLNLVTLYLTPTFASVDPLPGQYDVIDVVTFWSSQTSAIIMQVVQDMDNYYRPLIKVISAFLSTTNLDDLDCPVKVISAVTYFPSQSSKTVNHRHR